MSSPSPPLFFLSEKFQLWKTEAFYRKYNILKQFLAEGHLSLRPEFLLRGNQRETEPSQNLAAHRSGHAQADGEQQHVDLTTHTHKIKRGHPSPVPPIQPCYWNNCRCKLGNLEKSKGRTQKSGEVLLHAEVMLRAEVHTCWIPAYRNPSHQSHLLFICMQLNLGSTLSWLQSSPHHRSHPAPGSLDNGYFRLLGWFNTPWSDP